MKILRKKTTTVEKNNLPKHIAIIMDGNGRWAKKRGNIRLLGHKKGVDTVNEIVTAAAEIGIEYLTLYAFSTENWNRPKDEVFGLMDLLVTALENNLKKIQQNNVVLRTIGDINSLPPRTREKLQDAVEHTKQNTGLNLILALSYSARWEIEEMVKRIAQECVEGKISVENIDKTIINSHLCTKNIPDPELLIRTSGEYRISNFLLWQIAYTELYFTETLWPDFTKEEFITAIADYQSRERRFGKTGEQVQ
ncbi:MAG: isoprenyl transferase [Bacteroidales bacterium]|jgi:undecaprenyl diphosphate synthase|nr:isoprenyl transferase [Bacteroidales bacterium]